VSKSPSVFGSWNIPPVHEYDRAPEPSHAASTSYESLFIASMEPVLIVDSATETIVEANPAAALAMRTTRGALIGTSFLRAFDQGSRRTLRNRLAISRVTGSTKPINLRTADGAIRLRVTLSLFHSAPDSYLLIRLCTGQVARSGVPSAVFDAIDRGTDGFLITDGAFRIEYANRAFLELIDLEPRSGVQGEPLRRWLRLSEADFLRLRRQLLLRHAASLLTTQLRADPSRARPVEVCAIAVPDGEHSCWGFGIRALSRLN
jgi:PAS domain-containing protein